MKQHVLMKKNVLLMLSILFTLNLLTAQVTVTNAVFPSAGDIRYDATVTNLSAVTISPAGASQTWDFSGLTSNSSTVTVQAASTGMAAASFPTADIILPEIGGTLGEAYIQVNTNSLEAIGVFGGLAGVIDSVAIAFSSNRVDLQTPATYMDSHVSNYAFQAEIDPHAEPGSFMDSVISELEIPGVFTVDSIRVNFTATRYTDVDAHGMLTLPMSGTFDAIRIKNVDSTNTAIDIKATTLLGSIDWTDAVSLAEDLGFQFPDIPFLGPGLIVSYEFWTDTIKQPLMNIVTDDSGTVSFASHYSKFPTSTTGIIQNKGTIRTYPNPAYTDFFIDMKNFDNGKYHVEFYNIIGKRIWKRSYQVNGDRNIKIDVEDLKKGTYLYSVSDEAGRRITTRRIVVVKP